MSSCGARNADALPFRSIALPTPWCPHGVYCQSVRQLGKPAMDIQLITKSLTDAKELIASVLEMKANQKIAKDPAEKG